MVTHVLPIIINTFCFFLEADIADSDEDEMTPTVMVGDRIIPIDKVNDAIIQEMTLQEKESYIQVYQEYYSSVLD